MFRLRRNVNCDHNATTPVSRSVRLAMAKALTGFQANPSTPYREGRQAAFIVDRARRDLAAALNVAPETIIFTSGATEANNHVRSIAATLPPGRRHIIYNPMEHPAMLEPLRMLERDGFGLTAARPDHLGRIGVSELDRLWRPEVALVVMMAANNETGTFYDVRGLSAAARARGALFFSDMVQALGKIPLDLAGLGVDYATFSAHKISGPKGTGALYVRKGAPFAPLVVGGGQEGGRRAGTESLHNLAGFAAAVKEIPSPARTSGLRRLKEAFVEGLLELHPGTQLNSPPGRESQPGTVSVTLPGFDNAFLLGQLDYHGISVAAGSACRTGANEPSHVLLAMGLSAEQARSTLRLSFGPDFSKKDLRYLLDVFRIVLAGQESRAIDVILPGSVTEDFIFRKDLTIVHVKRFPGLKGPRPLPGSRVIALGDKPAWEGVNPPGPVFLTCEVGYDAPIMAWSLRRRGLRDLSVLALGLWGLKLGRPDLWRRLDGQGRGTPEDDSNEP
ncbi:MAG: cysteine desulfurase [Deltaproteobacteria bacterium]|jgi:cysteine desulfurase|nr:cysteine desulfurase [Deltaproteobacteria bacterium]